MTKECKRDQNQNKKHYHDCVETKFDFELNVLNDYENLVREIDRKIENHKYFLKSNEIGMIMLKIYEMFDSDLESQKMLLKINTIFYKIIWINII